MSDLHKRLKKDLQQKDVTLSHNIMALQRELQKNAAVDERVHQALKKTLPELHKQEKLRLLTRMADMENQWAEQKSKMSREIATLQQSLDKTPTTQGKRGNMDNAHNLQQQIDALEVKHRKMLAKVNRKMVTNKTVRGILADGTISGAVSGVVGGEFWSNRRLIHDLLTSRSYNSRFYVYNYVM